MSVLIKGMEMPDTGLYIVGIDNANGRDKTVVTVERMLCIRDIRQIVGAFELIPVPSHGRLIDADEMFEEFVIEGQRSKRYKIGETWELNGEEIRCVISRLPTIIPADDPKEE